MLCREIRFIHKIDKQRLTFEFGNGIGLFFHQCRYLLELGTGKAFAVFKVKEKCRQRILRKVRCRIGGINHTSVDTVDTESFHHFTFIGNDLRIDLPGADPESGDKRELSGAFAAGHVNGFPGIGECPGTLFDVRRDTPFAKIDIDQNSVAFAGTLETLDNIAFIGGAGKDNFKVGIFFCFPVSGTGIERDSVSPLKGQMS